MMAKHALKLFGLAFIFTTATLSQLPGSKFPPEVMARKASVVGVRTTPPGGSVTIDGVKSSSSMFILTKKNKPRVLRFELAGYHAVEKALEPGQHYMMGLGVNFVTGQVSVVEFDQPPGTSAMPSAAPVVAPAAPEPTGAEPTPGTVEASAEKKSAAASPSVTSTAEGPFGFDYGMTKQQVIDKLGRNALSKDSGINVLFNTAPKPHPDFEVYILAFSPEKGLLKVTAVSKNISTSEDGADLRSKYNYFLDALKSKYGKAEKEFDFCKANDVECESQYYMMELMEKNRYLNSFWTASKVPLPAHLQNISIDAKALDLHSGFIEVSYEFEGWDAFVDEQDKKRNSSF
jgi:hypothetical protein